MDSSQLLGITTFTYLFSTILYAIIFIFKAKRLGLAATIFTLIAFLVQTAGLLLRWKESYQMGYGHAPLTNMYESVIFFAWCIIFLYLLIEWKFKTRVIGAFAVPFAFLAMAYGSFASGISKEINPLVPALQSNWLLAHVVTCFIGYAAFAVAAGLGVMYLIKNLSESRQTTNNESLLGTLPALKVIDDITHKTMVFGFLWLSVGIITAAIWANSAWGTY
ncbi:MAG: cytochrome c biogenesis protein CcsA, partial [Proteobacteria bacterium]|nr:cytochrome c biogenesis protein CcsA [Pseudomonadota bacterium]